MNKAVWFAAGAGVGAWGVWRAKRVAEVFTPDGARDRIDALRLGASELMHEVRLGAAEREEELRARWSGDTTGERPATGPQPVPSPPDELDGARRRGA